MGKQTYFKINGKTVKFICRESFDQMDRGLIYPCEIFGTLLIDLFNKLKNCKIEYTKANAQNIVDKALESGSFDYFDDDKYRYFYQY